MLSRGNAALGYLFVRCSGVGLLDDAGTRAWKGVLLVATWLWVVFFALLVNVNNWVYDARAHLEHGWFEMADSNRRIATFVMFVLLGATALYIARRVCSNYMAFARTSATGLDYLFVFVWYMAVIMSVLLNQDRHAALGGLALHGAFFAWLVFQSKRSSLLRPK